MDQNNYNDEQNKRCVLWTLAQQDPQFELFYKEYYSFLTPRPHLPSGFFSDVFAILKSDPAMAPLADTYLNNIENTQKYAIPGLVESGVVIAALFLLRSHIKIKKDPQGRWEFLFEHKAEESEALEKLVDAISKFFN